MEKFSSIMIIIFPLHVTQFGGIKFVQKRLGTGVIAKESECPSRVLH